MSQFDLAARCCLCNRPGAEVETIAACNNCRFQQFRMMREQQRFLNTIYTVVLLAIFFAGWFARGTWDKAERDRREADLIETILAKGGK